MEEVQAAEHALEAPATVPTLASGAENPSARGLRATG
jgi:hypothetical protein